MFNDIFFELRNWWESNSANEFNIDEFERVESKHTRIRHDEDLREIIRVH